jgi:Carboxypeptidase regulatory-like domain/FlgD Ig-like domain
MNPFRMNPFRLLFILGAIGSRAALASPSLIYLKAPQGEVSPDSIVQLAMARLPFGTKAPDSCTVFRSATSLGDTLPGHSTQVKTTSTLSSDSTARVLSFKPSELDSKGAPQLGLGFHYLIVGCQEGKYIASEIPFWVASPTSATILTPKSEETSSSPNISWTPVPGVPAYHILLSDQALNIDVEKGSVSGASVIWQAITTKTSLAYGTPDPSGNFSKVPAPPLSPNVPYNLVILNNYDGRSALATSAKAQGLRLFTIKSQAAALSKPKNLEPLSNVILSASRDSTLRFTWSKAKSGSTTANTYKLYIYSLESQDAMDVLIPIFQTEVTDTFAIIDAKRVLLTKRYIWKVFALSDAGTGIVGDTSSFQYRNDVQNLFLLTKTLSPGGDTLALGDVRIEVIPVEGSANALPLFSLSTGAAEMVLAVGSYKLNFSKSGYLSQSRTVSLDLKSPLRLEMLLPPAACRITGKSVDADGRDLDNTTVTGVGSGKTVTAISDASGAFLLGVDAGTYAISFSKPDYQSPHDTILTLVAGKALDIGKVVFTRPIGALNGAVSNAKGVPLSGCAIQIKSSAGTLLRSLLTDDKGAFSAFLSPGNYSVSASRPGFTNEEKSIQLSEAVNLTFTLSSGASLVNGRITLLTRKLAISPQSSPLPGARIELISSAPGSAIQSIETDLRGEYSFSVDTGSYTLIASLPGRAWPDSAKFKINSARSTITQNISLAGLASIQGNLSFSPDTAINAANTSLSLLRTPGLGILMTVFPQPKPIPGGVGNMSFSFDGVPDGKYRVTCGLPGYGPESEPEVTIADGLWKTDLNLVLRKATKSLTFKLTSSGITTPGTIRLLTPQLLEIHSETKISSAAPGTYTLGAFPDSLALIPLSPFSFALSAGGSADTTVTLGFPFSHQTAPLRFTKEVGSGKQAVEITLEARTRIDSMFIIYGYGIPRDTFQVSAFDLAGAPGPKTMAFTPGPEGGLLTYYFVIHSGPLVYSNQEPAHRFRVEVEASHRLAALRVAVGDSLKLPALSRSEITLHAYDAGGNRLDSAVDLRGSLLWSANSAFPGKLGKKSHRNLLIQTESPSSPPTKPVSTSVKPNTSARIPVKWDTLHVTVTLDSIEKSLDIPVQVVSTRINKLVVSTTLGEVSELPAPTSFGLFITGFDTTTTPPTVMLPHPTISLIPEQAGTLKEMQVSVDANFIGPLRIQAKQINEDGSQIISELGNFRDSLQRGVNIGQTLRPGDSARHLFHDPRFELHIPDSAFTANSQIVMRMNKRAVAKTFSSGITEVVAGNLYEISNPSGGQFSKPPRLSIGIPPGFRSRKNKLQRFDSFKLAWKDLDSVATVNNSFAANALSSNAADLDGNYYGLLSESQSLTAGKIEVVPNPFSPLVLASRDGNTEYGARIRLQPESDQSAEVTLTLRIYNLDGEVVRHLVEHKTVPKTTVDFYWDGKTDSGRWARNGRYLVKVSATSTGTSEVKYWVKPVVLFQ